MQKEDKERVVAELTERLRSADTLFVADYRGLSMPEIDGLRTELLKHGARFTVVKNTLTRRAAEAAGADALLALLDGPSAIAFLESEGDPVAVAKALGAAARTTRVLTIRGGVLDGRELRKGRTLGVIIGPLNAFVGLVNAPLRDFVGIVEARRRQLEPAEEA